ncbi:hypothetical protein U1Q18_049924, partial [Sarracenia purpurea var. burkii]
MESVFSGGLQRDIAEACVLGGAVGFCLESVFPKAPIVSHLRGRSLCASRRVGFDSPRCSAGLGFSSPGLICLVGIRLGHSGSSDRHKARSLRPSLSGRRKIWPPDLVRLIGIRVGLPGLSIGACRSAMYGSTRLLVAPPFFSRCPVARIGPACRGFYSAQLLSYHGSGSPVWVPIPWFGSSLADGPICYQGDWSVPKIGGPSGLIRGCQ